MKLLYGFLALMAPVTLCSPVGLAQTPGSSGDVKFTRVTAPVPSQGSQSGNPAGEFYHATYTGAAWGDYDGDGLVDVFYSDVNPMINGNVVYSNLYANVGDGTFKRVAFSPLPAVAYSAPVWLDANGDGCLDLIVSGLTASSYHWNDALTQLSGIEAFLCLGGGDGTFEQVADSGLKPLFNGKSGGKAHNWAAVADYDHDGYTDVVMTGFDDVTRFDTEHPEEAVRAVYLYRNVDGKHFELQQTPLAGGGELHGLTDGSVVFCDLDADGWVDLLATGYGHSRGSEAYVYWNNGDGTFTQGDDLPCLPLTDSSSGVADLNGDGLPELVLTGKYSDTERKSFYICRNDGNRAFTLMNIDNLEGIDGGQLAFGDVNNDGLADILVGGHGATHEHTTCIYLNKGGFAFDVVGAYYDDPFGKKGSFLRVTHGTHHLVDVDCDGYLDAWFLGWTNGTCSKGCTTNLYHNDSQANGVAANAAPAKPQGLKAQIVSSDGTFAFTWQAPADDVTPSQALRYNFFLREKGSKETFMVIPASELTGRLKVTAISHALTSREYRMKLKTGKNYEWGVQAIDNGNLAGPFALGEVRNSSTAVTDFQGEENMIVTGMRGGISYSVAGNACISVFLPSGGLVTSSQVSGEGAMPLAVTGPVIVTVENQLCTRSFKVVI